MTNAEESSAVKDPAEDQRVGKLGQGAEAVVYALKGGNVALKVFKRQDTLLEALTEVERHVSHVHVVRVLGLNSAAGWLAMECVDGCSLEKVLERDGSLQGLRLAKAVSDVLQGIMAFHAHGIPHRDVKPGNVMQERRSGLCKLVDWIGQAAEDASVALGKPVGTPVFMAPEVAKMPHRHCLASDIWSLGCTIVNLSSGRLPWANADSHGRTNEFMAMWRTAHGHAPPHDASGWSPRLKDFVSLCFEPDPALRTNSQELHKKLLLVFDNYSECLQASVSRFS